MINNRIQKKEKEIELKDKFINYFLDNPEIDIGKELEEDDGEFEVIGENEDIMKAGRSSVQKKN